MRSRIAWSRNGFLAYIDSTHAVRVTWLRCADGENWEYVTPVLVPVASEARPVMLKWSTSNYDLAIADDLGRVQIVAITNFCAPMNQIVASGVRDQRQRPVELDRVVAMHWLGLEKNILTPQSQRDAMPGAKAWNSIKPLGPFHPKKGKGALVCVNGNGMLRMLVQTLDQRYVEVDAMIPGAHCVSRAAMIANGPESLLVMLVGDSGVLQIYEATVRWHPDNLASKQDFVDIEVHPIATAPLPDMLVADVRTLTAYRVVGELNVVVCVVSDNAVARYNLSAASESLHASFFELFGKSAPVQPDPHRVWILGEPAVQTHKTTIQCFMVTDTLLYTIFEDGSLATESLIPGVSSTRLDTLQLKFAPEELAGTVDLCLSPTTTCAAVYYSRSQDQPTIVKVKLSGAVDQEQMRRIARSLATAYASTVYNLEQSDDLVGVCREVLSDPQIVAHSSLFYETLVSEAQRLITVNLMPDDRFSDRYIILPSPLQRWLSFLLPLGTSAGWKRTPACRLALCLINLQLLDFSLTWTLKRVTRRTRATTAEQLRLDIAASQYHISAMLGPIRWATDLIARICQELYDAISAPDPPYNATYRENAAAYVLLEKPNVYNSLIFSSISRLLLKFFLRGIHTLTTATKNLAEQESKLNAKLASVMQAGEGSTEEIRSRMNTPINFVAAQTLRKVVSQLQAAPVNLDAFEKLLLHVDEKVKALVAEANVPDQARQAMDSELVKLAKCPSFYMPLLDPLIETVRTVLLPTINVPELYFYDTTWLGLDDEQSNDSRIDAIRKRIILPNEPVQQCTRCGMYSLSVEQGKPQVQQWSMLFHHHCVCGGWFFRESSEDTTAASRTVPVSRANSEAVRV